MKNSFLFGIATSSYHIEGSNHFSDWHHFEKNHFADTPEHRCGQAAQYWQRWKQDHEYLSHLGVDIFRTSIEWSRIEPQNGIIDKKALHTYKEMFTDLKKRDIKVAITLFHYVLPKWFADMGGFEKEENLIYWSRFVRRIAAELGEDIDIIIPANEIFVYASLSYLLNHFPPQKRNPLSFLRVIRNILRLHMNTVEVLQQEKWTGSIGSAEQIRVFVYNGKSILGRILTRIVNYLTNAAVTHSIRTNTFKPPFGFYGTINKNVTKGVDFVGIQFYPKVQIEFGWKNWLPEIVSQEFKGNWPDALMNSKFHDGDLIDTLLFARKFKKPMMLTEIGIQSSEDTKRTTLLPKLITEAKEASHQGVNVFGFLYFTLFDCFEWTQGYTQKFGLISIDRKNNLKRNKKDSFYLYKKLISE